MILSIIYLISIDSFKIFFFFFAIEKIITNDLKIEEIKKKFYFFNSNKKHLILIKNCMGSINFGFDQHKNNKN